MHPQLNRLTPYDQGQNLESEGSWCGGWTELRDGFDTMSLDGLRHGRPPLPGITPDDERRVYYFPTWPNLLLSLHPDYLMTHQVWPVEPGRSRVICEWSFHPDTMARPDFDASDAVDFLEPHQPAGLAGLRAAAARYGVTGVHPGALCAHGGYGPRLRRHARRRLCPGWCDHEILRPATTNGERP